MNYKMEMERLGEEIREASQDINNPWHDIAEDERRADAYVSECEELNKQQVIDYDNNKGEDLE